MEAARGVKTVGTIADENELHPVQVSQWKKELLDSVHLAARSGGQCGRLIYPQLVWRVTLPIHDPCLVMSSF